MIDLVTIKKIQEENLEKELENRKVISLNDIENGYNLQQRRFIEAEKDIQKAQEDFPEVLISLEDKIKNQIQSGKSSYLYYISDSVRGTYIVKMLLDVLPLYGFVCKFNEGRLEISW